MFGLKKLKDKREEDKREKHVKALHGCIVMCRWTFVLICFTCVMAYGLHIGSVVIALLGIAAMPVKSINDLWNKLLKDKATPVIKVVIVSVCFFFAIGLLPEQDIELDGTGDTQIVFDSESSEFDTQENETTTEQDTSNQNVAEMESESESESQTASAPSKLPDKPEVTVSDIPAYSGKAYVSLNGNKPNFDTSNLSAVSYEYYSNLDSLGRCGVVHACIGKDIMPTEERGSIGHIKPTGWHTVKYNGVVDGNYLYNRCHLIGYQLTGENDNEKNLITGTRQFNVEGMLPFENMVADYVKETNNHVMYRVTPVFEGNNLLATGVQMEAYSVEDNGRGICFNVFVYNVQDQIEINYANGKSSLIETTPSESESQTIVTPRPQPEPETDNSDESVTSGLFAVNGKNGKIHIVGECSATGTGSNAMTNAVYFDTYEEALEYSKKIAPNLEKRDCGNCW